VGDPKPGSPAALWTAAAALILCPGSLLFVRDIDAEPGTSLFLFVWLMVGLINAGLYGGIGGIGSLIARHLAGKRTGASDKRKNGEPKLPK
jgi:hypothetical protein